uniref:Uncharacterized protein n=1 Tax=Rhizophagus irregularis (strain DAOM 181602 / DAOM 197198 / MUCL 43194) TaxID=747089 RepID=U9U5Q0_RHIID
MIFWDHDILGLRFFEYRDLECQGLECWNIVPSGFRILYMASRVGQNYQTLCGKKSSMARQNVTPCLTFTCCKT